MSKAEHMGAEPLPQGGRRVAREVHSRPSRWMHWINFPLLLIMLWSGLRIYNANSIHALELFGFRAEFFGQGFFDFFSAERKLAKGIAFHLVFGWLFLINGLAYGAWLLGSGEWRQILPDRRGVAEVPASVLADLHLRGDQPVHGKYNAAQKLTYTIVIAMGAVMIVTGLAIYKPVQVGLLTWLPGGYEVARLIHFTTSIGFVVFFGIHILQVVRAGWGNFAGMISGYRLVGRKSPDPDLVNQGSTSQDLTSRAVTNPRESQMDVTGESVLPVSEESSQ